MTTLVGHLLIGDGLVAVSVWRWRIIVGRYAGWRKWRIYRRGQPMTTTVAEKGVRLAPRRATGQPPTLP